MPLPTIAYRIIGRFSTSRFDRVLHPFLYRRLGGRGPLGRILGSEMVVLTTRGRRTGEERPVALFGFPVGEREGVAPGSWAVVGSRGGSKVLPAWYRNVVASPEATLQVRGRTSPVVAREVPAGPDYEAIFEIAARGYPGYRLYRAESPIHIPIVVLEPDRARSPAEHESDERA